MRRTVTPQLLILLVATFFYMSSIMMTGPVIASFCAVLGGSGVVMGLTGGLCNFTSLFCRPFLGELIDRHNWRKIGLAGLACMSVGACISAAAPSVWGLMLGRVLTGTGFAVSSSTLSTWVATSLSPEHIGRGMGLYGIIQAISQAISPAIGLYIAAALNYRAVCIVSAILALCSCLLVIPLRDTHSAAVPPAQWIDCTAKRRFLLPELLPVALIVFLFCVPYNGTSSFLVTVAQDRGLDFNVGSFFTLYALFLLVTRLFLSRILDTIPFWKAVLFCIPFGVISMLCLQWMRSWHMMIVAALLLTFAYGMIQPVCQTAGIRSVSSQHRGLANCTYYIGLDLGLAVGPMLSGVLYQLVGEGYLFFALACIPLLALPVLAWSHKLLSQFR